MTDLFVFLLLPFLHNCSMFCGCFALPSPEEIGDALHCFCPPPGAEDLSYTVKPLTDVTIGDWCHRSVAVGAVRD